MFNKEFFKLLLKDYLFAISAGLCISLGGIAFLSCESKIAGALFFTVGLFVILVFDLNLFTGKVCYALENKPSYILRLLAIWFGNLTGAVATGYVLRLTRLTSAMEKCVSVCQTKLNDNLFSIFILAILCNVLIFIAVHGFKNSKDVIAKYLSVFFGVSVFVLCGFEHCVANMFYFSFANAWTWNTILYLLVMTAGNIVGGLLGRIAIGKLLEKRKD